MMRFCDCRPDRNLWLDLVSLGLSFDDAQKLVEEIKKGKHGPQVTVENATIVTWLIRGLRQVR